MRRAGDVGDHLVGRAIGADWEEILSVSGHDPSRYLPVEPYRGPNYFPLAIRSWLSGGRRMTRAVSLKGWMWRVALVSLACALITAAAAALYSWQNQITHAGQGLTGASKAIVTAVEFKLDEVVAFGRAMASSSALRSGDIKTFEGEARRAATGLKYWLVVNAPESGRQIINTIYPAGTILDDRTSEDWIEPAAKDGNLAVKGLQRSRATGEWVQIVQIPVQDGQRNLIYVLSVVVPVSEFQNILDDQRLPPGWISVLVGSRGKVQLCAVRCQALGSALQGVSYLNQLADFERWKGRTLRVCLAPLSKRPDF